MSFRALRAVTVLLVGSVLVGSCLCAYFVRTALFDNVFFRSRADSLHLDVVVPVHKINCMLTVFIEHINTYIRPTRILIATKQTQCADVENISANVKCLDEDKVVPGVTKDSITATISDLRSKKLDNSERGWGGHSIAGWYLQQFIKLGVAATPLLDSHPLSEVYLVLDSDAIPFADVAKRDKQGRMPLMAGGTPRYRMKHKPKHTVTCDYFSTYFDLTGGLELAVSADRKGYVPHHMVMQRTYVMEMLAEFAKGGGTWYNNILNVSCRDNIFDCECGFSEYASMASWVKRNHPDAVYEVSENFLRYADGQHCCADDGFFEPLRAKHKYKLILFERGACR